MRLRIRSDGTPGGTRLENDETGEVVEGVVEIVWRVRPSDDVATAWVTFWTADVDVVGEVVT